jgi:hypothetical protein
LFAVTISVLCPPICNRFSPGANTRLRQLRHRVLLSTLVPASIIRAVFPDPVSLRGRGVDFWPYGVLWRTRPERLRPWT